VLYNSSDPESRELAEFYAKAREIPKDNLIGIPLPKEQTIERKVFENKIRKPLVKIFHQRKWWTMGKDPSGVVLPTSSRIPVLAIMRGVPLRIKRTKIPTEETKVKLQMVKNNEASVDSELAMMSVRQLPIGGFQNNRYYNKSVSFGKANLPFITLVGRIDAPTVDICKRMITDAVATEKDGLWGRTYIDFAKRGGGYKLGDDWLEKISERCISNGIPTIIDRQKNTFPTNYPMTEAAVYFGWYSHHRNGPLHHPKLRFKKGSVITHLHSFSAQQLRKIDKNWSAAILAKGAAATVGNVYEPFLKLTHDFNIFHLLQGYSLVEAAYMAIPVLSWQNVVLGDPLYRPFLKFNEDPTSFKKDREYKAMRIAAKTWKDPEELIHQLRIAAAKMKSGTFYEGCGYQLLEIGMYQQAEAFFGSAKANFKSKGDKLRQDLNIVEIKRRKGKKSEALAILAKTKAEFKGTPEVKAAVGLTNILNPPPPKPAKPKGSKKKTTKKK